MLTARVDRDLAIWSYSDSDFTLCCLNKPSLARSGHESFPSECLAQRWREVILNSDCGTIEKERMYAFVYLERYCTKLKIKVKIYLGNQGRVLAARRGT